MESILFLLVVALIISYPVAYVYQIFTFNFGQLVASTILFFVNIIIATQLLETYHWNYAISLLTAGFLYYTAIFVLFKDTIYESFYDEYELERRGLGKKAAYRKKALSKAPPITFTNSKDVLDYYDSIVEYAEELSKEFKKINKKELTSNQYVNHYSALVKESYTKMFVKFPHLLTIVEDLELSDSWGRVYPKFNDKFDSTIFKNNLTFSKGMVFVDFEIEVEEVSYYIVGCIDRENTTYRYSLHDGKRYERINKHEMLRMTGYINDIHDYEGWNDGVRNKYVEINVEEI